MWPHQREVVGPRGDLLLYSGDKVDLGDWSLPGRNAVTQFS